MKKKYFLLLIIFNLFFKINFGQPLIIDEIVAVIGDQKIFFSDIEKQYLQLRNETKLEGEDYKCNILEMLLAQKLLVNQAIIDSLEVTEFEIESQLDQRLKYFINVIGSKEKLEEYYNKSIIEIKDEMRGILREQILSDKMRGEIAKDVNITPSEVRDFYNSIPEDSLPYINAKVEISQIVLYPPSNEEAIREAKEKLLSIRQRILNGENFKTLAVLYSEDGSALNGGDIGWKYKAELDNEYVKAVASLKEGQISRIVETSFGFHIIQLLGRTEDRIHTRHILIKPKISMEEKEQTMQKLDSIVTLIRTGKITFEQAALMFSMDEDTRANGGVLVNENTGNKKFELSEFDTRDYLVISKLSVGEISEPYESYDKKGRTIFKVVTIKSRTNPHVANLKDDYDLIKKMALNNKEQEVLAKWLKDKISTTYIKINEKFKNCDFAIKEWKN